MIVFAAVGGAAWLFIPLAAGGRAIPFLVAAQVLFGFCAVAANITGISLYQAITPDRMLGRMNASRRFVVWGVMPVGGLVGGVLGSHLGLRPTLWLGAAGASIAFVPMLFSPFRHISVHADAEEIVRAVNEDFVSATAPSSAL